eukprot:5704531-Amphidinium_carterae.1
MVEECCVCACAPLFHAHPHERADRAAHKTVQARLPSCKNVTAHLVCRFGSNSMQTRRLPVPPENDTGCLSVILQTRSATLGLGNGGCSQL